jgi:hypothetical protein
MDSWGLPRVGPERLKEVEGKCFFRNVGDKCSLLNCTSDFDMKTPGAGLMTVNAKMWGPNPETSQTELLKQFNTLSYS